MLKLALTHACSSLCPGCIGIGRGRRGNSIVSAAGAEAAVDAGAVGAPCPNGTNSPQSSHEALAVDGPHLQTGLTALEVASLFV